MANETITPTAQSNNVENPTTLMRLYETLRTNSGSELEKLRSKKSSGGLEPMIAQCVFREITRSLENLERYASKGDASESANSAQRALDEVLSPDVIERGVYPEKTRQVLHTIRGYFEEYRKIVERMSI